MAIFFAWAIAVFVAANLPRMRFYVNDQGILRRNPCVEIRRFHRRTVVRYRSGSLPMLAAITGLTLYLICEILIRRTSYEIAGLSQTITSLREYKWECWKDIVFIISPGYWLARRHKQEITKNPTHLPCHLKKYIKANNNINLGVSAAMFFFLIMLWLVDWMVAVVWYFVLWRFVSRSFEIAYAFGNDAVTGHANQRSSLTKYDRISLALKSYCEIFLYSACVYLVAGSENPLHALLTSLGVGTLTNVSQVSDSYFLSSVAYVQIITTISLVVLSLAVYVSRDK